jgi:hypothetical protein
VTVSPQTRKDLGDVYARDAALERIRNELDQAIEADPLGLTRLHVALSVEKGRSDP